MQRHALLPARLLDSHSPGWSTQQNAVSLCYLFPALNSLTSKVGCDTYMALVIPAPNSDCNAPCQADATELCGSGNRLAVYQDMSVSPPDFQTCLTNQQFVSSTGFRFDLQAVPRGGSVGSITSPTQIGTLELPAHVGAPSYFILSVSLLFSYYFPIFQDFNA